MANISPKVLNISLPSASPTRGSHAKRRATNSRVDGFEWHLPGKSGGSSSYVSFLSSMQPFSSSTSRRLSLRSPLFLLCGLITLALAISAFVFMINRLNTRAADKWSTTTGSFSTDSSYDSTSWPSSTSFGKSNSLGSSLGDDEDSGFGSSSKSGYDSSSSSSMDGDSSIEGDSSSSLSGDTAFASKGWSSKSRPGFGSDSSSSWSKSSSSSLGANDENEEADSNKDSSSSSTLTATSSWPRKRSSTSLSDDSSEDGVSSKSSFSTAASRGFGSSSGGRLGGGGGYASRSRRSTDLYPDEALDPSTLTFSKTKKKRKGYGASWSSAADGESAEMVPVYGIKKKHKKRSGAFAADADESASEADSFNPRKRSRFADGNFYGSSSSKRGRGGEGGVGEGSDDVGTSSLFRKSRRSSKRRKRAGRLGGAGVDAALSDVDSGGTRSSWKVGRGKGKGAGEEAGESDEASLGKTELGSKTESGLGSYGAYGRKRRRKSIIRSSSSLGVEDEPSASGITIGRRKKRRSTFGSGAADDVDGETGGAESYGRKAGIRGGRSAFGVEESSAAADADDGSAGGRRKAKVRGRWATGLVGQGESSVEGDSGADSEGTSSWASAKSGYKKGGRGSVFGAFGRKGLSGEDGEGAEDGAGNMNKLSSYKGVQGSSEDETDDAAAGGGGGDLSSSTSLPSESDTETAFSSEEVPSETRKKGSSWNIFGWFGGAKKDSDSNSSDGDDSISSSNLEDESNPSSSEENTALSFTRGTKSSDAFSSSSSTKAGGAFSFFGTRASAREDLKLPPVDDQDGGGASSAYGKSKSSLTGRSIGGGSAWNNKFRGASSAYGRRKLISEDVR